LPSGQASLIGTLETPLMAFWVYLGFGEIPSLRALIGGALVMGAVVVDILADVRAHQADAAAKAVTSGE
jgi:drug/metabolite transporter (DMT)-like permease